MADDTGFYDDWEYQSMTCPKCEERCCAGDFIFRLEMCVMCHAKMKESDNKLIEIVRRALEIQASGLASD